MITKRLTLFFLFLSLTAFCQKNIIKLPISFHSGYGAFNFSYVNLTFDDIPKEYPLYKSLSLYKYKNIPSDLSKIERGLVMIDPEQLINQAYISHDITKEEYTELLSYAPVNNLRKYSKTPIASVLLFIKGIDHNGKEVVIVDCNNNGDFADETAFEIEDFGKQNKIVDIRKLKTIRFEIFNGRRVVSKVIPMRIFKLDKQYLYNFPQFATAQLKIDKKIYQIAVTGNFLYPAFTSFSLGLNNGNTIKDGLILKKSGLLSLGMSQYQIIGIDPASNLLVLKKLSKNIKTINQPGFEAPSIEGKEILSSIPVKLKDHQGKYVYLDFWGSWCAPCIDQIPELKEIYDSTRGRN